MGHFNHLFLAAAYARTGQIDAARQTLAEVNRQSPYLTVRSVGSNYSTSPVYRAQVAQFQDALRLAGARDHADEDADFGVAPDGVLHRTGLDARRPRRRALSLSAPWTCAAYWRMTRSLSLSTR